VVSPAAPRVLEELFAPFELLREIGSPARSLHLVRQIVPGAKPKLLVAERFADIAKSGDTQGAAFVNEARRISTLASSNMGRVRQIMVRGEDLVVFWDFIDGGRLADVWLSGGMPLELAVRLILDVLSGVNALHGLRDAKQQPMHLAHGELSPATIVVGLEGAARVLHPIARRAPGASAEEASLGYLAPEVHAGQTYGARADVFSAGVLLWEAIAGQRLFSEGDARTIAARIRSGVAAAPAPAHAPWAKGLAPVAARALAPLPDDRWPSAAAMAAEIRKAVGLRLAPATAAAAFAKAAMGDRAKARREELETATVPWGGARPGRKNTPPPQPIPPQGRSSLGARVWEGDDSRSAVPAVVQPPADVLEVGPETGVDLVADSLPPPAPSATRKSIDRPASEAAQASAPSPPPLPARALPAPRPAMVVTREAIEPEETAIADSPHAIDVSMSIAPPPMDPFEVEPTSVEQAGGGDQSRRRRAAILGGVGALGLIVFALAGWRVAYRDGTSAASPERVLQSSAAAVASASGDEPRAAAPVVAPKPARPTAPPGRIPGAILPTPAAPTPSASPPSPAPSASPPSLAASRSPRAPVLGTPAPVSKTTPVAAPSHKASTPPASRSKPRATSGYDPNSL
jgi:serine/threonine-protein kinase